MVKKVTEQAHERSTMGHVAVSMGRSQPLRSGDSKCANRLQFFFMTLLSALFLTNCELVKHIADNAPAAKPPGVTIDLGAKTCPTGTVFLNPYRFGITVQSALFNKITIEQVVNQSGVDQRVPVPEFDGNDPNNGNRTVYIFSKSVSADQNAGWRKDAFTILAPVSGWGVNSQLRFVVKEGSINPKFQGTPQEFAETPITGVIVSSPRRAYCPEPVGSHSIMGGTSGSGCKISLFNAPTSVMPGDTATLNWRVLNCIKAQILEGSSVSQEKTATSPQTLEGTYAAKIQQATTFELRAYASGAASPAVSQKHTILANAQCPGGAALQNFTFCVTCPGNFKRGVSYQDCSEADAKKNVQSDHSNCTVSSGTCP